ncbi:MAG: polyphosphate kinase 2 family protein [Planctomycetota bacterium]|nr:polyphosphate kinase 2 family protein [Planctomycetota bacterium]
MAEKKLGAKDLARFRVEDGRGFRLAEHDPGETHGLKSKDEAQELLAGGVQALARYQERLAAQDRWSLLVVFQAMDAAGKDGTIEHVMSGVNPAGVHVTSFKAPSEEELDHDWMWRHWKALPERGRIGIFNRSHYEEVLVVRVHEQLLAAQKIPRELVGKKVFEERLQDIANFESFLARNGTRVLKFFLNVSKAEQKKRFLERIDQPDKNWKFAVGDVRERAHWDAYQSAYEDAIRRTAAPHAPWYVVPADKKWFTRLVVAAAIEAELESLDLSLPPATPEREAALRAARAELEREG